MRSLARSGAANARIARDYSPSVVQQLEQIEADLGGRDALIGMLVLAPLNHELRYTLSLLGNPKYADKSLASICALGNILPGELLKHLSSAALLKGKILASQQIGRGIAAVAADIMKRAAPYEDDCHTCLGIGTITADPTPEVTNPAPEPCPACLGRGKLLYRPDLERQKLAVDLAHLLPKSGGIQMGVQINQGEGKGSNGGGTFDAVQRVVDQVLYGKAEGAVEAEVVPEEGDGDQAEDGGDPAESDPAGGAG